MQSDETLKTGALMEVCGYHVPACTMDHPADSPAIHCPNEFGVCATHYDGNPPEHKYNEVEEYFEVPGVVKKTKRTTG